MRGGLFSSLSFYVQNGVKNSEKTEVYIEVIRMHKRKPTYAGFHNILKSCQCGSMKLWVITYYSFLQRKYEVECPYCGRKTRKFWFKNKAIKDWNDGDKYER